MLHQAKMKAAEAGLRINFIQADIRTLDLQKKYDLILFHLIRSIIYMRMKIYLRYFMSLKSPQRRRLISVGLFNPNIRYIVEGEKEQQEIATYTTGDGREVSIKQTMRYEIKPRLIGSNGIILSMVNSILFKIWI